MPITKTYLGTSVIGVQQIDKFDVKMFMMNRRISRTVMKDVIKAHCKRHKVSMSSLRRSCNGKPSLNKLFDLVDIR